MPPTPRFVHHKVCSGQEGSLRIGDFDAALDEAIENAPVEFALHRPTLPIVALQLAHQSHVRAINLVDAPEIEVVEYSAFEVVVSAQFRTDFRQRFNGAVDVRAM